jgi:hypothetical protein
MAANESAGPRGPNDEQFAKRLEADLAMLWRLVADGFEVDGGAVAIEGRRWMVYGHSAYDGGVVLAEYDDPDEATAVLRAVPRRRPAP